MTKLKIRKIGSITSSGRIWTSSAASTNRQKRHDDHADDRRLHPEPPEPDAPAGDHVLLAELLALEPEQARARDQPVEDEVDEPAEDDDEQERRDDRPEPGPALGLVQPDDDGRRRQERDDGRGTRQPAPLAGELARELALLELPACLRLGRHP